MNNKISNRFAKLLLIAAIAVLSMVELKGQSVILKMGNGLSGQVHCSCTDTAGNVYAITGRYADTLTINKWNVGSKKWSVYTMLTGPGGYRGAGTCNLLNGMFYVTRFNPSTKQMALMEYSGIWNNKGDFNFAGFMYTQINSIKFKNQLYFFGNFDSVNSVYAHQSVAFNGSVFSATGFLPTYIAKLPINSQTIYKDSLYLAFNNRIMLHKSPNTWSTYYTNNSNSEKFNSIAISGDLLYAATNRRVYIINRYNGLLKDSLQLPGSSRVSVKSVNNGVFVATSGNNGTNSVYSIEQGKNLKFIFRNLLPDTNYNSLLGFNNNLYYHGSGGVNIKGTDYVNISQIMVDTLVPLSFDTIRGSVFWDKNNNNIKDVGDEWPKDGELKNITDNYTIPFYNNTGVFEDIIVEDHDAEYALSFVDFDSCVQQRFSGNVKTHATDPGVTTDTLSFPMARPSLSNINLVLNNLSSPRARLHDTIQLAINVKNKDCNYTNTNNGTVTVTLDTGTVFYNSTPAYTSKVGSVYTFSNLTFNYFTDNIIKLDIIYSHTKYSLGNKVRHYARLSNIMGEDTMDNMDSIVQTMVYSYDPNAKYCEPEGKITSSLKNIRYHIHFQNEGNADAVKVTIVDTLNLKMPVYEFRMVGSSHNYKTPTLTPGTGVVTWVFENINLKPKSQNEEASKGWLIFDAKVKGELRIGDSIRNKAYIYFDYNSPIVTNYAVILRVEPTIGIESIEGVKNKSLRAYPNPAGQFIKIENILASSQSIMIYDLKGAQVYSLQLDGGGTGVVNTGNWTKGLYVLVNERGESIKIVID